MFKLTRYNEDSRSIIYISSKTTVILVDSQSVQPVLHVNQTNQALQVHLYGNLPQGLAD